MAKICKFAIKISAFQLKNPSEKSSLTFFTQKLYVNWGEMNWGWCINRRKTPKRKGTDIDGKYTWWSHVSDSLLYRWKIKYIIICVCKHTINIPCHLPLLHLLCVGKSGKLKIWKLRRLNDVFFLLFYAIWHIKHISICNINNYARLMNDVISAFCSYFYSGKFVFTTANNFKMNFYYTIIKMLHLFLFIFIIMLRMCNIESRFLKICRIFIGCIIN